MQRPSGLYIGNTNRISNNYQEYIDSLPKSCESIESIINYLTYKEKTDDGLGGGEGVVLEYAESKLKPIGGGRPSKKRPTARRLRSSKARKVRKARATRRK